MSTNNNGYEISVAIDAPALAIKRTATFAEARIVALMYLAYNPGNVVSIYGVNRQIVAAYTSDTIAYIVIDGSLWENATDRDGFDLATWDGITVNDTPFSTARTAAIVEGPRTHESDLTQHEFSLASFLDNPFPARGVDGSWYLVK